MHKLDSTPTTQTATRQRKRDGIRPLDGRSATMQRAPELCAPQGYGHARPEARAANVGMRAPKGYARVLWVTARPQHSEAAAVILGALCTTQDGARYWHTRKRDGIAQVGRAVPFGPKHVRLEALEALVGVGRAQGYDVRLVACGGVVADDATHTPTSHKMHGTIRAAAGTRKPQVCKPNRQPAGPEMFIPPVRY